MKKDSLQNAKLGLFIISGIVLFVIAMYFIGSRQNMFVNSFHLNAVFKNVSGLQKGNTVRYMGIDIGTVKEIHILSDSVIEVKMSISEDVKEFIKKNAIASVGTDGLMGNKLINISPVNKISAIVENNDYLNSRDILDTDNILEKLQQTNNNLLLITEGLVESIQKANNRKSVIGRLLSDTVMAEDFSQTLTNLKVISIHFKGISSNLNESINSLSHEEGSILAMLSDTSIGSDIQQVVEELKIAGNNVRDITEDIAKLATAIDKGEGSLGILLKDAQTADDLESSIKNIKEGTRSFNQIMDALKKSILFKKYFRNLEEEEKQQSDD